MALYQMYLMIICHVIVLFMNITYVWEKVSMHEKLEMVMENDHCGAPLFKSNRNLFWNVKWWYLFSKYRFTFFHVAWRGRLHILRKISWVYITVPRLCWHWNLVKFGKRAVKTLQHVHRYGDILMFYDMINTHKWIFCNDWHELYSSNKLLDFSSIYCLLVK